MRRDPPGVAGQPDLPPAPRRPRRPRVRRAEAAHDGRRRRAPRRRPRRRRRATRASRASARCCGARRSTSCRTSSTSCAARWRSSARARRCRCRSPLHRARARPPGGQARASPAGRRSTAARRCRGRAHRARPLVHRAPLAAAGPPDPAAQRAHGPRRRGPLPRRGARVAGPASAGRCRSAADGVALHAAGVRAGMQRAVAGRGRPRRAGRATTAPASTTCGRGAAGLDDGRVAEPPLQGARRAAPRAGRTSWGSGRCGRPGRRSPPAGSPVCSVAQEQQQLPLVLLVAAGGAEGQRGGHRRAARGTAVRVVRGRRPGASEAGPPRARTSGRGCRGGSRVRDRPARTAASRRWGSPTTMLPQRSTTSRWQVSPAWARRRAVTVGSPPPRRPAGGAAPSSRGSRATAARRAGAQLAARRRSPISARRSALYAGESSAASGTSTGSASPYHASRSAKASLAPRRPGVHVAPASGRSPRGRAVEQGELLQQHRALAPRGRSCRHSSAVRSRRRSGCSIGGDQRARSSPVSSPGWLSRRSPAPRARRRRRRSPRRRSPRDQARERASICASRRRRPPRPRARRRS